MKQITVNELENGDIVDLGFTPYGSATVIGSTEEKVTLYRPYIHFDTSVEIEYIGTETITLYRSSKNPIKLIRKA